MSFVSHVLPCQVVLNSTDAADIDLCVLVPSVFLMLQRLSNYVAYPWTFVRCHLSHGNSKLSEDEQKLLDIVASKQGDARQILFEFYPQNIHHEKVKNHQDEFGRAVMVLDALARWEFDGKPQTVPQVAATPVADAPLPVTKSEGAASSEQKTGTSASADTLSDAPVFQVSCV